MKRMVIAATLATGMLLGMAAARAAAPEPVGISLLRIEMKKALLQQDAAPKVTQLRQKKLQAVQTNHTADEMADAEVDLIQAQSAEAMANVAVKELELQLQEALKSMNAPPPPPPPAPGGAQPNQAPGGMRPDQGEPAASPEEISMLQFDLQKAKIQADAAAKISDNRQKLLATRQTDLAAGHATPDKVADTEADTLAAQINARLADLEVEASQMRLDAAMKSAAPKK